MKNFYVYGASGDLIYSIPAIRKFCNGEDATIIHGQSLHIHSVLKPLIDAQPGLTLEHESSGIPAGFYNIGGIKHVPFLPKNNIQKLFAKELGVEVDPREPWLTVPDKSWYVDNICIVNITNNYRDKLHNWKRSLRSLTNSPIWQENYQLIFLGLPHEYEPWKAYCQYKPTNNYLEAAIIMSRADRFMGTQSALLAIAEGLGMKYSFERSPFFDNCITGSDRETILNPRTYKLHFMLSHLQQIWRKFMIVLCLIILSECRTPKPAYKVYKVIKFQDETPYWEYDTIKIKK